MANVFGLFEKNPLDVYVTLDTEQSITATKHFEDITAVNIEAASVVTDIIEAADVIADTISGDGSNITNVVAADVAGGSAGRILVQLAANQTTYVAVGSPGQVLTCQGTNTPIWTTISTPVNTFTYVSTINNVNYTATIVPPSVFRSCYFILAGGGGGGGIGFDTGEYGANGGSGACGQTKIYTFGSDASSIGLSFQIVAGGGGSGGDKAVPNADGTNGGNSSVRAYLNDVPFDNAYTAGGGGGGYHVSNVYVGGSGGNCSSGNWTFTNNGVDGNGNGFQTLNPISFNSATITYSYGGYGNIPNGPTYFPPYTQNGHYGFVKVVYGY